MPLICILCVCNVDSYVRFLLISMQIGLTFLCNFKYNTSRWERIKLDYSYFDLTNCRLKSTTLPTHFKSTAKAVAC